MVKDGDVLLPTTIVVDVPTNNKLGVLFQTENPYPFTHKAVVVSPCSVAENDLPTGTVVTIDTAFGLVRAKGSGDNAYIQVNGFIHPDVSLDFTEYPTDPENEHYGYFLVPNHQIKLIVQ